MRKESDPIDNLRALILAGGISDEEALKTIDGKVKAVATEAAEFAQQNPEPEPEELYTDILVEV